MKKIFAIKRHIAQTWDQLKTSENDDQEPYNQLGRRDVVGLSTNLINK